MKKELFYMLTFFTTALFLQPIRAQNSSPYWSLAGNSNATATSKLGTTNAINLRILTNNVERLRVTTSGFVGIGTLAPTDRLHINSASGANALRAQVNGSTKLLLHSGGGLSVGSGATPPANGLYVSGNVGIGVAVPEAKLHVLKANAAGAVGYVNAPLVVENSTHSYVNILAPDAAETGVLFGKPASNISGGIIYNNSGNLNGLQFRTHNNTTRMVLTDIGNLGVGTTTPANKLHVRQSVANRAIQWQHESQTDFWTVGIGTNTLNCRFEFNGALRGQISATDGSFISGSDSRLKEEIEPIPSLMNKLMQLKPSRYFFKDSRAIAKNKSLGFIAHEVEKIFPEMVYDFDGNYKGLNYSAFSVIAIKAIQEQQLFIEEQNIKNATLEDRIVKLEAALAALAGKRSLTSMVSDAGLGQNSPNPVRNSTRISYNVPSGTAKAQLHITDNLGKTLQIKQLDRSGTINLNTSSLSSGVYNYSLVVDGKTVETKKMTVVRN